VALPQHNTHSLRSITYWVEASVFPSGLKAAAMVDLGGGKSGQYLAEKCLSDSDSAHDTRLCLEILATSHLGLAEPSWHLEASPHNLFEKCFV
jgi:hypothetical protein